MTAKINGSLLSLAQGVRHRDGGEGSKVVFHILVLELDDKLSSPMVSLCRSLLGN